MRSNLFSRFLTGFQSRSKLILILILSLILPQYFYIFSYASDTPIYGGSCTSGSVTQTIDTSTGAQIEIFRAPASGDGVCSFTVPSGVVSLDYLVVAGGGGGSSGGGGAGGLVTNRQIKDEAGTTVLADRKSGLAVRSGQVINSIIIGAGGNGGWGGSTPNNWGELTPVQATNGNDSQFGSIVAKGGGAGGWANGSGSQGGSSGGNAYDAGDNTEASPLVSDVVGANSRGSAGGPSSGSGGYRAGAGGGGAGTPGGNVREINSDGVNLDGTSLGGGGHGGDGVLVDIYNTGEFSVEFACGGGGGVNNNSDTNGSGWGGDAGCSTAGAGSSYGAYLYGYLTDMPGDGVSCTTGTYRYECFTGTLTTAGFGGGGGGTDPEGISGGAGGSGIVVISYFVNNSACPNNGSNATSTRPLACNFTVSIRAGRDTATVDPRAFPYSYSDTPTTTARLTIGVDSITITVTNSIFTITAPDVNNPLRGGTYPALYSLTTTGTDTSSAYININVTDPAQHTPTRVGINPWVTTFKVPSIVFGTINAVLVCITPRTSNVSGYGNTPTVTMSSVVSNALRTDLANGGIKLEGTVESITANASNFRIVKNAADTRLLPGTADRIFDVNVSNTATGGNGSCTGGSESTLTIYRLGYSKKNTKNLPLGNGKQ